MYVVDRDFGFAPNPFHGICTLATCKPGIRSTATVGDWVIGMGGSRLHATGRCIFAMCVTDKIAFDEYWSNPKYLDKKPIRNGSSKMMVGDNIYWYEPDIAQWHQSDSHHSNPDGSTNMENLRSDTKANSVLVSSQFIYFGVSAPIVPSKIINQIGYKNCRNHRVFDLDRCQTLIRWLCNFHNWNMVLGDPFDFSKSDKRYSRRSNRVS